MLPPEITISTTWSNNMQEAPDAEDSLLLYSEAFIDNDFNRSGVVEGYFCDGKWFGSFWNPCHDTYDSRECKPEWWALKRPPYVKTC